MEGLTISYNYKFYCRPADDDDVDVDDHNRHHSCKKEQSVSENVGRTVANLLLLSL